MYPGINWVQFFVPRKIDWRMVEEERRTTRHHWKLSWVVIKNDLWRNFNEIWKVFYMLQDLVIQMLLWYLNNFSVKFSLDNSKFQFEMKKLMLWLILFSVLEHHVSQLAHVCSFNMGNHFVDASQPTQNYATFLAIPRSVCWTSSSVSIPVRIRFSRFGASWTRQYQERR